MDTITKTQTYYTDKDGNLWDTKKHSEAEAIALAKTMTNCKDCINCIDCQNCERCDHCNGCSDCINVSYCYDGKNLNSVNKAP